MAGAVALASTGYIAAIDEKAWAGPRRLGPGVQGSHSVEPALPTETARVAEYARRKVESSFWSGGWIAAQLRPRGQADSQANATPEELRRDWLVPAVINSFTSSGSTMIYRNVRQNPLGVLIASNVTNILGRSSATVE